MGNKTMQMMDTLILKGIEYGINEMEGTGHSVGLHSTSQRNDDRKMSVF